MASMITLQGPDTGRQFPLEGGPSVIGRQPESAIFLESLAVSRLHALVIREGGAFYVEDTGSSNGTFVNGKRIEGRTPLTERDTLQVGPYVLALRCDPSPTPDEGSEPVIRASITALPSNQKLLTAENATHKLQVVLEIAQHLARTPEESLLGELLDHLLVLFPQADRGLVLLCEGDRLAERAHRSRGGSEGASIPYSRTIVQRALDGGIGILSEDIASDRRMDIGTVMALNLRSLLCVPLICKDGRRLGIIQLDTARPGTAFRREDLELLTAVGLQAAVVLDNAALHAERLRDERLRVEVAMAREIQNGFLPVNYPKGERGFELFACVHSAYEVSGDLYDFFFLEDGRLAFYVGDVTGKGMPAALFMVAVHTLFRHLASSSSSPSATLAQLDAALAADNPSDKFVTVAHGLYEPRSGEVVLAAAAHPLPLLRRANGQVEVVPLRTSVPIGYGEVKPDLADHRIRLGSGETLIFYTDGFTEARVPGSRTMFEEERLRTVLGGASAALPLKASADRARAAVQEFIGAPEQQDDLTLLMLRRL
jgi:serine phosphatase RsbU (regulator of sigma subunit)